MRQKVLAIGVFLFAFSIVGYMELPNIINRTIDSFIAKDSPVGTGNILRQMGFPSIETITQTAEYSFLTMSIAGVGVILVGGISKKKPAKKVLDKMVKEDLGLTPVTHDEIAEKPKKILF